MHVLNAWNKGKGALFALIAAWLYATIGLAVKNVGEEIAPEVIVWYRGAVGLIAFMPLFFLDVQRHGIGYFRPIRPRLLLMRTVASLGAGYLLFYALTVIPLTNAILLSYTRPLWVSILAWLVLKKRLEKVIWASVAIGFVGVVLILQPGAAHISWGSLAALGAGFVGAIVSFSLRHLNRTAPADNITFNYFWTAALLSSIPLIWLWQTPSLVSLAWLVAIGVITAIQQMCLTRAFRYVRTSIANSVLYSVLVFTLFYSWIFFDEIPDLLSWLGIILICASAIVAVTFSKKEH